MQKEQIVQYREVEYKIIIDYDIVKQLGSSGCGGVVYEVIQNNETFALKVCPITDTFENEIKMAKMMSTHEIGPIFYKSWKEKCKYKPRRDEKWVDDAQVGFILMEKMQYSLSDKTQWSLFFNQHNKELILSMLEKLLNTMIELRIDHKDLQYGNGGTNITLDFKNGEPNRIRLIDFATMRCDCNIIDFNPSYFIMKLREDIDYYWEYNFKD